MKTTEVFRRIAVLGVGIITFLILPLAGWGIIDPAGFLRHPARMAYVVLTILLQVGLILRVHQVGMNRGTGTKTVKRQRIAVVLLQVMSMGMMVAAGLDDRWAVAAMPDHALVRGIGLLLYTVGLIGMHWAEVALGKQFSVDVTIQKDHELVTHGPYRWVRHPRYSFMVLFGVGMACVFRSGLALGCAVGITAVLLWRVHDEEALLGREFGDRWTAYARKSWKMIPLVF